MRTGSRTPVTSQNEANFSKLPSSDDLCTSNQRTGSAKSNNFVATVTSAKSVRNRSPTMRVSVPQ